MINEEMAKFIADHIEENMYTKYDFHTFSGYLEKATIHNQENQEWFELRLHDASKDPGLHSFWIFESGIYDKPRCEDLAKEIRKHLAKSQLHQDFEKVETSVGVYPNEDAPDSTPYITIYINATLPKPSFKFKYNLTNLKDLSSFENFDRDVDGQRLEDAAQMLRYAIRERDEKIAAEEAHKRAEEEAELARQKALEEQVRLENEKNLQEWERVKKFVDEIGDFEVKVPLEGDDGFIYMPIRQVISFEYTEDRISPIYPFIYWVNFGYHMNFDCDDSTLLNINQHGYDEAKKIIIDWAVSYGAKEPEKALAG